MHKQLIERIALEVAQDIVFPGFEIDEVLASALTKYASALLARIDAERGRDAAAWLEKAQNSDEWFLAYSHNKATETKPLFLSPTIPEGMALVPIEPTIHMVRAGCHRMFKEDDPTNEPYHIYQAMLAAAQGERNA